MGSQPVRLDDELINDVRAEADTMSRSIAGQVEYWLRLGRAVERTPSFSYDRVRQALHAQLSPDELTAEEQELWWELFDEQMSHPGPAVSDFYRQIAERDAADGVDISRLGDSPDTE